MSLCESEAILFFWLQHLTLCKNNIMCFLSLLFDSCLIDCSPCAVQAPATVCGSLFWITVHRLLFSELPQKSGKLSNRPGMTELDENGRFIAVTNWARRQQKLDLSRAVSRYFGGGDNPGRGYLKRPSTSGRLAHFTSHCTVANEIPQ